MSSMPHPGQSKLDKNAIEDTFKPRNKVVDNIVLVDSDVNNNKAVNNVQDFNARNHALGLHKGHARQISDSLNAKRVPVMPIQRPKDTTDMIRDQGKLGVDVEQGLTEDEPTEKNGDFVLAVPGNGRSDDKEARDKEFQDFLGFDNMAPASVKKGIYKEKSSKTDSPLRNTKAVTKSRKKVEPLLPVGDQFKKDHMHREPQEGDAVVPGQKLVQPEQGINRQYILPKNELPNDDSYYVLLHSGQASKVHGQIHAKLQPLPNTVSKEAYIFTSKT